MNSPKHRILHLLTTMSLAILSTSSANTQERSSSSRYFDTTGLVIRVCVGDLPGQKKEPGADYIPTVCAYSNNNSKLNKYEVDGFDLIYRNPENGLTEIVTGKGDRISMEMRRLINRVDCSTFEDFFIDNVHLTNKKGKTMVVTGIRPFWPPW